MSDVFGKGRRGGLGKSFLMQGMGIAWVKTKIRKEAAEAGKEVVQPTPGHGEGEAAPSGNPGTSTASQEDAVAKEKL